MTEVNHNNTAFKMTNLKTYLHDMIQNDVNAFNSGDKIKTGYDNLDAITSLYPGLYVVGAISSLGKTTFMYQMADQLANNGNHVLSGGVQAEIQRDGFVRVMRQEERQAAFFLLETRIEELAPVSGILVIPVVKSRRPLSDAPGIADAASRPAQADGEDREREKQPVFHQFDSVPVHFSFPPQKFEISKYTRIVSQKQAK